MTDDSFSEIVLADVPDKRMRPGLFARCCPRFFRTPAHPIFSGPRLVGEEGQNLPRVREDLFLFLRFEGGGVFMLVAPDVNDHHQHHDEVQEVEPEETEHHDGFDILAR